MSKLSISNIGSLGTFKNKIINGGFDIWQRGGGSGDHQSGGDYSADRWVQYKNGAMVLNPYKSTGAPTYTECGRANTYTMRCNVATADTSIAASDYALILQPIEGYNIVDLLGKTCTLSFWARAVTTGTYCVAFRNSVADRSYVAEFTINSTTTWEYKTVTFTMDDGLTGTWDFTNGVGLYVNFILAAGSNFQTTPGSWQSGSYLATSNQVNGVATTDDHLRLSMVQLEVGSSATSFESRSIQQELALCQRYFEKSYDLEVTPADSAVSGFVTGIIIAPTVIYSSTIEYLVDKRAQASITYYKPPTVSSAGLWAWHNGSVWVTPDGMGTAGNLFRGFTPTINDSGMTTLNPTLLYGGWTADAEL